MTKEIWVPVEGFSEYLVSNKGRIMNNWNESIKTPHVNQQSILSVKLHKEGREYRREVALLVAKAFVPKPKGKDSEFIFDTPINLNRDRSNNSAENLAWRPRWFAVKYHKECSTFDINLQTLKVKNNETKKKDTIKNFSEEYGILMIDIYLSCHNHHPVFPTKHTYSF